MFVSLSLIFYLLLAFNNKSLAESGFKSVENIEDLFKNPLPTQMLDQNFEKAKTYDLVKDFGGKGDGKFDNKDALLKAIKQSTNGPIKLKIPAGEYYYTIDEKQVESWPEYSKGLYLMGDSTEKTVLLPHNKKKSNKNEAYALSLHLTHDQNAGFRMENLTIDGKKNPQEELFWTMKKSEDVWNTPLTRGIKLHGANEVEFRNLKFQHMYGGYGVHLEAYDRVNIEDVTFDKVGGNDMTQSFGQAIHLGGGEGDTYITVNRVNATGMVNPDDHEDLSWIGMVYENTSIQTNAKDDDLLDQNTFVNVMNSSFMNYNRTFHVEMTNGNVYWYAKDIKASGRGYFMAAGIGGKIDSITERLDMTVYPYSLSGLPAGMYSTESELQDNIDQKNYFLLKDSTVNVDDSQATQADRKVKIAAYGDNTIAHYDKVIFNNVPGQLVTNAGAYFRDCSINLAVNNKLNPVKNNKDLKGYRSNPDTQPIEYSGSTQINSFKDWK